jgi:DHA2 family multidrug resistance protein
MLFVPLTTIAMSQIQREQMGDATSLFNLMRNIGGSIGIATVTTMYARNTQKYVNRLGEDITVLNPQAQSMWEGLRQTWLGAGSGPGLADQQATASMFGIVSRQAALLSFVQLFVLLSLIFLAMLPFLFVMKRPPRGAKAEMGH